MNTPKQSNDVPRSLHDIVLGELSQATNERELATDTAEAQTVTILNLQRELEEERAQTILACEHGLEARAELAEAKDLITSVPQFQRQAARALAEVANLRAENERLSSLLSGMVQVVAETSSRLGNVAKNTNQALTKEEPK